jgi:outer membrane cobalamin receptor
VDSILVAPVPDSLGLADTLAAPAAIDSIARPEPVVRLKYFGILPAPEMLGSGEVNVINAEELRDLSSTTPGEALELDSGTRVTAEGTYGLPQMLSLRGSRPDEVTYLLDGVPVSDRQLEVFDLNWLPLAGVSKVEALKGGASSIHGSGAVGGVINVVPRDPRTDVPLSDVDMWWGDFGSRSVDLSLSRSFAGGPGVLGAYENVRCGGWIDDSSFEGEKMFGKLSTGLGRGRLLDLMAFRYEGDIGIPDSCPLSFTTRPGKQRDKRELLAVALKGGDATAYRVGLYRLDVSEQVWGAGGSGARNGLLGGVDATVVRGLGSAAITSFGLGFKQRELETETIGKRSSNDVLAFAHRETKWEAVRISGRLGVLKNSDFGLEIVPSLEAAVSPRDSQTVFVRADRSVAFPSLANIRRDDGDIGDGWDPQPEHSMGVEIGTRLKSSRWVARLAFYWTHVRDIIAWRADEECGRRLLTDRSTDVKGVDGGVDFRLLPWVSGSVSATMARSAGRSGDRLEYVPSRALAWRLKAERRLSNHIGIDLTFAGTWTSSVSAGNRFTPCSGETDCLHDASLPGYASASVQGCLSIDRARIFGRITNVFDEDIYPAWGMPRLAARSYQIGFTWQLID